MDTSAHISLEMLADIAEDRLTGEVLEAAMVHASKCSACDDSLRRLRKLMLIMNGDSTEEAPPDVLTTAINIFSRPRQAPLPSIVAILIFDSRRAGPAFGMRSVPTASRQLLFSAQDTDLDLRITVQNGECIVAGQVIRDGNVRGLVEMSGAMGSAEAILNELCEFTLPAVPVGNYSLRVRMLDVEIEIPELDLKD